MGGEGEGLALLLALHNCDLILCYQPFQKLAKFLLPFCPRVRRKNPANHGLKEVHTKDTYPSNRCIIAHE